MSLVQRLGWHLIVLLMFVASLSPVALAHEATPVSGFGLAESVSPVVLYEALLTTPIPDEALPAGFAGLEPYEWRDSNDSDLAGAIGGVIFADGDPFGSQLPTAITYLVYSDANGPRAPLATAAGIGVPAELLIDGQSLPSVLIESEEFVGIFTAIDNVFVYGMVHPGIDGVEQAATLTQAGIAYLLDLAATLEAPTTTPAAGATRSGEDAFLALAAAPFPVAKVPFEVGALVVLPMYVRSEETAGGLEGALLVRDADRIYAYPLVIYRFYEDETDALDAVSAAVRDAGMSAVAELPPEIEIPYPTTIIDRTNKTTMVLVQVGSTVVIGNAPSGDLEDRHRTAMTLAQTAVSHLEEVGGAASVPSGKEIANSVVGSPARLYDALLTASFPDMLLPEGVGPLETSPWQDANDPDLVGSLGGVTYSNGDLLADQRMYTIAYVVFPDSNGAETSLANAVTAVESLGATPEPCTGIEIPSVVVFLGTAAVCVARYDHVVISGMAFTLDDSPEKDKIAQAAALVRAGIAHLRVVAEASAE